MSPFYDCPDFTSYLRPIFRSTFSLNEDFKKWDNWTAICKRMKLEHSLTLSTKTSSKWIKNLNTRLDTIKW